MEHLVVRSARVNDFIAIAEIKVAGWQSAYSGIVDEAVLQSLSAERICETMRENEKKDSFMVAEANGIIVAFCRYNLHTAQDSLNKSEGAISELYVKPDLKRMGIGGILFRNVLADFKDNGINSVQLRCFSENSSAKSFYEKMNGAFVDEKEITMGTATYLTTGYRFVL